MKSKTLKPTSTTSTNSGDNLSDPTRPSRVGSSGAYADLYGRIQRDDFQFPTLPTVIQSIHQVAKDPDSGVKEMTQVIQADPGLTAHMLKSVNSVGFRRLRKIKTLRDAITRMGLNAARYHATVYTVRNLFQKSLPGTQELMHLNASNAVRMGANAYVLSTLCKGVDADQAMLGALLQDIGLLPLIEWIAGHKDKVPEGDMGLILDELAENYAVQIGVLILENWHFDKTLCDIVRARKDWARNAGGKLDVADIINLARIQVQNDAIIEKRFPPLASLPAFEKLPDRTLTQGGKLGMLIEHQEEIQELESMMMPSGC